MTLALIIILKGITMIKPLRKTFLSLFSALFLAGTILPASVISYAKPAFAADAPVQTKAAGLSTVSAGMFHSLALSSDGTVWAWGDNSEGQLGNKQNELPNSSTPVQVKDLTNIVAVAAGGAHSLALKNDGTVWGWGNNEFGQAGFGKMEQIAGGSDFYLPEQYLKSYTPLQVQGLTDVIAIAAGMDYSLALKADGTVWAWGNTQSGQLGNPSEKGPFTNIPAKVAVDTNGQALTGITKISAGSAFALALKNDGTVWTWGGLLVDEEGVHNVTSTAIQVHSLTDVINISAGYNHSLALKSDGTVWGWGKNDLFQLGDRDSQQSWNTPLQISGINNVHSIVAGTYLSLVLKTDGTVWSWGGNLWGQLGDAVPFEQEPLSMNPVQVKELTNATALASGLGFVIARQSGGTIQAWGANSEGQLGNNTYGGPVVTGDILNPDGTIISGVNSPVKSLIQAGSFETASFTRLAGLDAMETSVKISQEGWPAGASTAILATVVNFPDALAAAPLAHQYDAPVLLTESKELTPSVEQEISRLKPSKIIIVGGTAVVSQEIEDFLKQTYEVTRLSGYDQYETAAEIAANLQTVNPEISGKAVIAYGGNFPDALAISSLAAYQGIPILLTERAQLPAATKTALQDLNVTETIIVGGTAVVSSEVEAQLTGVKRYAGIDQYQTGIAIAKGLGNNFDAIYLATGDNFPDALAGSALAARTGSPIILVDKYLNSTAVTNFLTDHNLTVKRAGILGGTAVITPGVWEKITRFFTL